MKEFVTDNLKRDCKNPRNKKKKNPTGCQKR